MVGTVGCKKRTQSALQFIHSCQKTCASSSRSLRPGNVRGVVPKIRYVLSRRAFVPRRSPNLGVFLFRARIRSSRDRRRCRCRGGCASSRVSVIQGDGDPGNEAQGSERRGDGIRRSRCRAHARSASSQVVVVNRARSLQVGHRYRSLRTFVRKVVTSGVMNRGFYPPLHRLAWTRFRQVSAVCRRTVARRSTVDWESDEPTVVRHGTTRDDGTKSVVGDVDDSVVGIVVALATETRKSAWEQQWVDVRGSWGRVG